MFIKIKMAVKNDADELDMDSGTDILAASIEVKLQSNCSCGLVPKQIALQYTAYGCLSFEQ